MALKLVIGNKNYSSWSLRPWLALAHAGIPFEEIRIPLYGPDSRTRILSHTPSGKVPALVDGNVTVWDSLAILEYLAERFPENRLWPSNASHRAHARSICAEMHAGFAAMRAALCMNLRRAPGPCAATPEPGADILRVKSIWTDCLARHGGPFLFGTFTNADAMYAPVVARFLTYAVPLDARLQGYADTIRGLPAMAAWYRDALAETEVLPQFDRAP